MSPPSLQPPGWYDAQGDPPGTHRWWAPTTADHSVPGQKQTLHDKMTDAVVVKVDR